MCLESKTIEKKLEIEIIDRSSVDNMSFQLRFISLPSQLKMKTKSFILLAVSDNDTRNKTLTGILLVYFQHFDSEIFIITYSNSFIIISFTTNKTNYLLFHFFTHLFNNSHN